MTANVMIRKFAARMRGELFFYPICTEMAT